MMPPDATLLLLIDMQQKLLKAMCDGENVLKRCCIAAEAANELHIPVIVSEQYPAGLGPTAPELAEACPPGTPFLAKTTFSCFGTPELAEAIHAAKARHLVIAGVESHVCVYLTALAAHTAGLEVTVAADCVSSRRSENVTLALAELRQRGIHVLPLESILFDLLGDAKHPAFKAVSKLIR